jgi:hypothetical protein
VPVNEIVYRALSEDIGDFTAYRLEVPVTQYVGARGIRAMLTAIKVNQVITALSLPGQGVDDDLITDLCPLLQEHERLHVIDLRSNPGITDASCIVLAKLIKSNTAITDVLLEGTSLCPMVQRTLCKFANSNKNNITIFLDGDYTVFKMLFERLDLDRSGAVSMLDILSRTADHDVFDAVERRFKVMDLSGDAKLQIDEFLNFLHPNFFPMKARLVEFLKAPDDSEANVVANWTTIVEAARRSLIRCPSFHLARVSHKQLSLEEATLLMREAVVHEHKRSGATPEESTLQPPLPELSRGVLDVDVLESQCAAGDTRSQALLDMYTSIQARSMHFAVESLFGEAERLYWLNRQQEWSKVYCVRLPPVLARHCHQAFMSIVNENVDFARERFRDVHAPEVQISRLLATPIESQVWILHGEALRQNLIAEGVLNLDLLVTFAEWFTLLNDRFEIAFGTRGNTLSLRVPVAAPRK